MGLRYRQVKLLRGRLGRILQIAGLPSDAPERIMNGEVTGEEAELWREKARKALNSLPEYHEGVARNKNYLTRYEKSRRRERKKVIDEPRIS